ncbi:MAG: hypothetical protein HY749_12655 [Gammaproteobacteria bacterium]|nr:hypothetical protein [Gammaproteobacteria bacterium]
MSAPGPALDPGGLRLRVSSIGDSAPDAELAPAAHPEAHAYDIVRAARDRLRPTRRGARAVTARLLLADDHTPVRAGRRALLESLPGRETVDVGITDIAMRRMNGLQLAARVREDHPAVKP